MAEFGFNMALDSATGSSRAAIAQKVTLAEDGTLGSISVYTGNRALTDTALAIYSHNAGSDVPGNLIESHNLGSAPGLLQWVTVGGFSAVLSAGTYWLAVVGYGDKSNWGLSAPLTTKWGYSNAGDYVLPNPWSGSLYYTNRAILIYGTYTPSGGSTTKTVGETGSGADATSGLSVGLGLSDAGSGAEGYNSQAQFGLSEAGSGADLLQVLLQMIVTDAVSGSELLTLYQELIKAVAESGLGGELIALGAAAGVSDQAGAVEMLSILVSAGLVDQGAAFDALVLYQDVLRLILDSGTGAESIDALAGLVVSDQGTAIEISGLLAVMLLSDTGAAADLIAVIRESLKSISDGGQATEMTAVSALLTLAESGNALDLATLIYKTLAILDQISGADGLTVLRDMLREELRYLVRYKLQTRFTRESRQRLIRKSFERIYKMDDN